MNPPERLVKETLAAKKPNAESVTPPTLVDVTQDAVVNHDLMVGSAPVTPQRKEEDEVQSSASSGVSSSSSHSVVVGHLTSNYSVMAR